MCLLQHETTEEYKAAMGIGGLNHGEEDAAPGNAFQVDPAGERRKKYAAELFSRAVAAGDADAADEARRRAAADEIANQLLGMPVCLTSSADLGVTLPACTPQTQLLSDCL